MYEYFICARYCWTTRKLLGEKFWSFFEIDIWKIWKKIWIKKRSKINLIGNNFKLVSCCVYDDRGLKFFFAYPKTANLIILCKTRSQWKMMLKRSKKLIQDLLNRDQLHWSFLNTLLEISAVVYLTKPSEIIFKNKNTTRFPNKIYNLLILVFGINKKFWNCW